MLALLGGHVRRTQTAAIPGRLKALREPFTDHYQVVVSRRRRLIYRIDEDEGLAHSLVRVVQIIGEAANHVDQSIRESNPSIPWEQIISMRNRLVHAYYDINLDIVWNTVQEDLPPLIERLEVVLAPKTD